MTQVPPTRYSSATITRAPWPAAMRAARTPPDPAPMTKRSTLSSDMLVRSIGRWSSDDPNAVWVRQYGGFGQPHEQTLLHPPRGAGAPIRQRAPDLAAPPPPLPEPQ